MACWLRFQREQPESIPGEQKLKHPVYEGLLLEPGAASVLPYSIGQCSSTDRDYLDPRGRYIDATSQREECQRFCVCAFIITQ